MSVEKVPKREKGQWRYLLHASSMWAIFWFMSVSVLFRACLVLSVLTEMAGGRHYSILTKQITKVQIDTSVHSAFLDH